MAEIIQFRRRDAEPPQDDRLLFSIDIYAGDQNGFHWIVASEDESSQPDAQQLSDYLGDMFIALNPQPPSILERVLNVIRNVFHHSKEADRA